MLELMVLQSTDTQRFEINLQMRPFCFLLEHVRLLFELAAMLVETAVAVRGLARNFQLVEPSAAQPIVWVDGNTIVISTLTHHWLFSGCSKHFRGGEIGTAIVFLVLTVHDINLQYNDVGRRCR